MLLLLDLVCLYECSQDPRDATCHRNVQRRTGHQETGTNLFSIVHVIASATVLGEKLLKTISFFSAALVKLSYKIKPSLQD